MRQQRETAFYDMPMIDKNSLMHISSGIEMQNQIQCAHIQVKQVNFAHRASAASRFDKNLIKRHTQKWKEIDVYLLKVDI